RQCWHEATLSSTASIPSSLPTTYADGYCRAAAVENTPARDVRCYRVGGAPWAVCTRAQDCGEQGGDSALVELLRCQVLKTRFGVSRRFGGSVGAVVTIKTPGSKKIEALPEQSIARRRVYAACKCLAWDCVV